MATRPHSEHSLSAINSLLRMELVILNMAGSFGATEELEEAEIWISVRAPTVLATTYAVLWNEAIQMNLRIQQSKLTIGFESAIISCNWSRNPLSITNSGLRP